MSFIRDVQSQLRKQGAPVTVGLIVALVGMALYAWLFKGRFFEDLMFGQDWWVRPWSLITYPFAYEPLASSMGLLSLVFLVFWMLFASASMEREVGAKKYAIFWVAATILFALVIWLGGMAFSQAAILSGPMLPIAAQTVAWGTRNQSAVIRLYGIIPLSGKWLAWLTVGFTLFGFGASAPLMGVIACLPLAAAWAFASNRIPFFTYSRPIYQVQRSKAEIEREKSYFDDVRRREQERDERERLRQIFERSLIDDPDDRRNNG